VRRIVCKRLRRRLRVLSLADYDDYLGYLEKTPAEWECLAAMCRIPISRFYRDKGVFDALGCRFLPLLARAALDRPDRTLSVWSAGCASGEEPYTVAILWSLRLAPDYPGVTLRVLATDADAGMIERARRGCYRRSSLGDAPKGWIDRAFCRQGDEFCVRAPFREAVTFDASDLLGGGPGGQFDLVLCRNAAFTYLVPALQRTVLATLSGHLRPGGFLVVGAHERLPDPVEGFRALAGAPVYEKISAGHDAIRPDPVPLEWEREVRR
jgi:chemotaxis protein methyltransferase CheR